MAVIGVRVPDEIKEQLEEIAKADHRPMSNLLRMIILEWLEEKEATQSSSKASKSSE